MVRRLRSREAVLRRASTEINIMPLDDLLAAHAVLPALKVKNKKQALQELSAQAAQACGREAREIFEVLLQRERLGSTGIGNGVAIPHGKLARLERLCGLFARLERPVDFDSLDGEPVDLIFLLLAPEGAGADHLKALARIARILRDERVAEQLRAARDENAIRALLTAPPAAA
jgi:PTS system nitrogen regulatory IIA component